MAEQRLKIDRATKEKFDQIRRLEELQRMDPVEFERFVGYLFQQQGYIVVTTAVTGDEGIDLLLRRETKAVVVQCKRYAGTVSQSTIRDLYGAMIHGSANEAMLVTTGTISRPAEEWAQGKPIRLINGHDLMAWVRTAQGSGSTGSSLPSLTVNWRLVGMLTLLVLLLGMVAGAGWLAWRTLSSRTAVAQPPVIPTAVATAPPDLNATYTPEPVLAATVTLPSSGSDTLNIPRLASPPILDGDLLEWDTVPSVTTPYITERESSWDGSMDVTADWRLAWDENNLYLGVRIVDDIHVQIKPAKLAYLGDSLELQLDTNVSGDWGPGINGDDFQYIVSPGDFNTIPPGGFRFQGNSQGTMNDALGSQLRVMAVKTAVGYQLEAAIPWADLNLTPSPGFTIGVALSTNDNDTPGSEKQELMLSHISTRRWLDPTTWGSMTLQP